MLATEQILQRMDDLYDEGVQHPRNTKIRGELTGLAEALQAAYALEMDDLRWLLAQRAVAREHGTQPPTIRRLAERRIHAAA